MHFRHCLLGGVISLAPLFAQDSASEVEVARIELHSRTIEIEVGESPRLRLTTDGDPIDLSGGGYFLAHLRRIPTEEDIERLTKISVRLLCYLQGTNYVLHLGENSNLSGSDELIAWLGALEPRDRMHPALAEPGAPTRRVGVQFFCDVTDTEAHTVLSRAGFDSPVLEGAQTWMVEATTAQIASLTRLGPVKRLWPPRPPTRPSNVGGRRVANTDAAQLHQLSATLPPLPEYLGVSGDGIRVGVCDFGINENHPDFSKLGTAQDRFYADRSANSAHGTHVAGILAGNGYLCALAGLPAYSLRGHAPEALLGDYPAFSDNKEKHYEAIVTHLTNLTNHSLPQTYTPLYVDTHSGIDQIVRGDAEWQANRVPPRPQVWAAGNRGIHEVGEKYEGYFSVEATAKNTICVGSVDVIDSEVSLTSSLGPTMDGRLKPDLVAPGAFDTHADVGIWSTNSFGNGYSTRLGTSTATPVVSGVIALVMQKLKQMGRNPEDLLPSTYKAVLIQTAKDIELIEPTPGNESLNPDTGLPLFYHAGPDYASGYGIVNAAGAVNAIARPKRWREPVHHTSGAQHEFHVDVRRGSLELRVTLAWDDLPGCTLTPQTSSKLVNDLDLVLVAPNGDEYHPWVLPSLQPNADPYSGDPDPISVADVMPATREIDRRNNVEVVSLWRPRPGCWKVRVTATKLPLGGTQPYSLVASHDLDLPRFWPFWNCCR